MRIDKGASRKWITRNRLLDVLYPRQTGLDTLQTAHGFGRKSAYVGVQSASHKYHASPSWQRSLKHTGFKMAGRLLYVLGHAFCTSESLHQKQRYFPESLSS